MPDPPPPEWITWIKELGIPTVFAIVILIGIWKGSAWIGPQVIELFGKWVAAQIAHSEKSIELQTQSVRLQEEGLALHKENTRLHKENAHTSAQQFQLLEKLVEVDAKIFASKRRRKKPA